MIKKVLQIENITAEELFGRLDNISTSHLDDSVSEHDTWKDINWLVTYMPERTSVKTIQFKARNGELPAYKLGRTWYFKKEEIDAFLESHKVKPQLTTKQVADQKLSK